MGLFQSRSRANDSHGNMPIDQSSEMSKLDRAKLEVRTGKNRLTKWSRTLERDMDKLREAAKECMLTNKKEKAFMLLKLRKLKASALKKAQDQILNIETMILEMESSEMNVEVMGVVQKGTAALNSIHKIMSVESVEDILEESEEAIAKTNEINEILGMSDSTDIDMDEVEEELEALVNEEIPSALIPNLPDVPTGKISVNEAIPQEDVPEKKQRVLLPT